MDQGGEFEEEDDDDDGEEATSRSGVRHTLTRVRTRDLCIIL